MLGNSGLHAEVSHSSTFGLYFYSGLDTVSFDDDVGWVDYEIYPNGPNCLGCEPDLVLPPADPESQAEDDADSSDEGSGDAGAPSQADSDAGAESAPSSPGSITAPEQTQNELKPDDQRMHTSPSLEDLWSIRKGLERNDQLQSVYVPYNSDHQAPAASARRHNALLLDAIVSQNASRRNVSHRTGREPPMQERREPSGRADRSPMQPTLRIPVEEREYEGR